MSNKKTIKGLVTRRSFYVSDYEIVKFITENDDSMEWNNCCDYVRKFNITGCGGENAFWDKEEVFKENSEKEYNTESIKWMKLFFENHPDMDSIVICFDD